MPTVRIKTKIPVEFSFFRFKQVKEIFFQDQFTSYA